MFGTQDQDKKCRNPQLADNLLQLQSIFFNYY